MFSRLADLARFGLGLAGAVLLTLLWMFAGSALTVELPGAPGVAAAVALVALFLYVHVRRGWLRDRVGRRLDLAPVRLPHALLGVAVVLTLFVANVFAAAWLVGWDGTDAEAEPTNLLVRAVVFVALAPLAEEVGFRGWVQTPLEAHLSPAVAVVLVAGVFAAVHGDAGFVIRFTGGVLMGATVWAAGSVWPAVALHAVNNGAAALLSLEPLGASVEAALSATEPQWGPLALGLYAAAATGGTRWVQRVRESNRPAV